MTDKCFNGPIFIVGLGRSGTKLLRDLLNNHPQIGIPEDETGFIPNVLNKYSLIDLSQNSSKKEFYNDFAKTSFFVAQKDRGNILSYSKFSEITGDKKTIESIIEIILRFYSPKGIVNTAYIWGDKTPRYMDSIMLLQEYFPNAKFIHIYRDVRDYALSYKKTWKKSIYLSAWRWNKKILQFESIKNKINFLELSYEDLLKTPENALKEICQFIDVTYDKNLLTLKKETERYGDAKNEKTIKTNNFNKFQTLKNKKIKTIEAYAYNAMQIKGYQILYAKKPEELRLHLQYIYKLFDFLHFFMHILFIERGIISGFKYILFSFKNKSS